MIRGLVFPDPSWYIVGRWILYFLIIQGVISLSVLNRAPLQDGTAADNTQSSDMDLLSQRSELEFQFSAYQRLSIDCTTPQGIALVADYADIAAKLTYIYDILVGKSKQAITTHLCYKKLRAELANANHQPTQALAPAYLLHTENKTEEEPQRQFGSYFRNTAFIHSNFFRLLLLRVKRFASTLEPVGVSGVGSRQPAIFAVADQIFRFLAFIYYLPRLAVNLCFTLKRVIPGPWMENKQEQELGWWNRLKHQWGERWFQFANDTIWVLMGVLTGFVLSTPMGMLGIILLYAFDVGAMAVKLWLDSARMDGYLANITDPQQLDLMQQEHAKKLQDLKFSFAVTIGLLAGMTCGFGGPLLATGFIASVVCPIVGMILVLLTCMAVIGRAYVWPKIKVWLENKAAEEEARISKAKEMELAALEAKKQQELDANQHPPPLVHSYSLEDEPFSGPPSANSSTDELPAHIGAGSPLPSEGFASSTIEPITPGFAAVVAAAAAERDVAVSGISIRHCEAQSAATQRSNP